MEKAADGASAIAGGATVMQARHAALAFVLALSAINPAQAQSPPGAAQPVTVDNFIRAETDLYMSNMVKDGSQTCSR